MDRSNSSNALRGRGRKKRSNALRGRGDGAIAAIA